MCNNLIDLQKIWYPEKYESTYIYTCSGFNEELKDLMSKSGYEDEFKHKYRKALRFLENLKQNCVEQASLFECLKGADGLHSIKLKGRKNIRILFSFEILEGRKAAILYCCFEEKKTGDYRDAISIAQSRRKEIVCG